LQLKIGIEKIYMSHFITWVILWARKGVTNEYFRALY
jgi:hypothetical protein